ncbi:MAG TPA: amidohydrolase family protein [Burkholderiales bacterium]|nr:amidohydrolase family protein [Burkholderiales bacterium]
MFITDAQVHIWELSTPQRPWPSPPPPAPPHRPQPFSKDDLLREMDAAGVERAVLVPPSWIGEQNDLALDAARLHPDRFAVMGRIDPAAPGARVLLTNWRQPGMLGLRFTFARPELQAPLNEGRVDWVWAEAEKAGLPVMMIVAPAQLHLVDRIAQRHPGLKLVMDHLALHSRAKEPEAFADLDKLLVLAKRPNVATKATCLPSYARDSYPYASLHPYLRRVYDAFGPTRMFWGTDVTRLPCSYRQAITMFTEELPWLTTEDKSWIMGRGICEWLGWQLP